MAWLFAGFSLLFLAAVSSGPLSTRHMWIQIVAMIVAVAALWLSLRVYPDWVGITFFLASGAFALAVQWFVRPKIRRPARIGALAIGSAFVTFALFGPKDGLF